MRFKSYTFKFITILFLFLGAGRAFAQNGINDTIVSEAVIYNGDTIEAKTLSNVSVYGHMTPAQMMAQAEYNRLRNAVYVT